MSIQGRLFAERAGLSPDEALGVFYHSTLSHLVKEGVSDLHCMSDAYLAEDLEEEYRQKIPEDRPHSG